MYLRIVKGLTVLSTILVLAACSGPDAKTGTESGQSSQSSSTGQDSGATTSSGDSSTSQGFSGNPLDNPDSLLSKRVVYFAYNADDANEEDRVIVEAHGAYLADNPNAAVTLEGHADERGSREYNIALGERRANSVRQLMTLIGAGGAQIRVVSYGEERPAVEGHDEGSWNLNRRVEIVYRNR